MSIETYPKTPEDTEFMLRPLLERAYYDRELGLFRDRKTHKIVGGSKNRRLYIYVLGFQYPVGHLVWAIETGIFPTRPIVYRDKNPMNTHFDNLMEKPKLKNRDKDTWRDGKHLVPYNEVLRWAYRNSTRDRNWLEYLNTISPLEAVAFS